MKSCTGFSGRGEKGLTAKAEGRLGHPKNVSHGYEICFYSALIIVSGLADRVQPQPLVKDSVTSGGKNDKAGNYR